MSTNSIRSRTLIMQLFPTPSAPTMAIRTLSGLLVLTPPPPAALLLATVDDEEEEETGGCSERDLRVAASGGGGGLFMRTWERDGRGRWSPVLMN